MRLQPYQPVRERAELVLAEAMRSDPRVIAYPASFRRELGRWMS
jgi:hypothetical protein